MSLTAEATPSSFAKRALKALAVPAICSDFVTCRIADASPATVALWRAMGLPATPKRCSSVSVRRTHLERRTCASQDGVHQAR